MLYLTDSMRTAERAAGVAAFTGRWLVEDAMASVRGRAIPTPPKDLRMLVGGFESATFYRMVGRIFVDYARELCQLRPDQLVLDVGCGCGQIATELTNYLHPDGAYEGFDIVPSLIDWCADNISGSFPAFRFQCADVANASYNPTGTYSASDYRFPYPDGAFDVVFAKSVFTHLLDDAMQNYVREVARVLRSGGRCLMTFFLLNDETARRMAAGHPRMGFRFPCGSGFAADEQSPEGAIAYPEDWVRAVFEEAGLQVVEPIRRGSWSGCEETYKFAFQDIVVATPRVRK